MFCFWALQTLNLFHKGILKISITRPTHVTFFCQNQNTYTQHNDLCKMFRGYVARKYCPRYDVSNLRGNSMRHPHGTGRTIVTSSGVIIRSFKQNHKFVRTDDNYFYYSIKILVFSTLFCFIL